MSSDDVMLLIILLNLRFRMEGNMNSFIAIYCWNRFTREADYIVLNAGRTCTSLHLKYVSSRNS